MTPPVHAFVALGSNIRSEENLPRAIELLAARTRVLATSSIYRTRPVGRRDVPPFRNAAVQLATTLTPRALKAEVLRPIEEALGRVRTGEREAPRTIDLDLVLYGDLVLSDPEAGLWLPDPEILRRAHLALPLAELAPELTHPTDGRTLEAIAAPFREAGGHLWEEREERALRR